MPQPCAYHKRLQRARQKRAPQAKLRRLQQARERCRVRHWDKNGPGRIPGAWPKRKWGKRRQRVAQAVLVRRWRQVEAKNPASRSRWPWTWRGILVCFGSTVGSREWWALGGAARNTASGQALMACCRASSSGEGKLVVPADVGVRRPDPRGPGGPCRDHLPWLQVPLERTWAAWHRRCRRLPPPLVIAASWFGDEGVMAHVASCHRGTLVVAGQTSYIFHWPDGHQLQGTD